jgi:uncharacterized protein
VKPKQERKELKRLYSKIPTFKCVEGCSDCCGPVPASRQERKKAPALMQPVTALEIIDVLAAGGATQEELAIAPELRQWAEQGALCIRCPYVLEHGGGCAIYDDRPFLCRLFGTIPSMPCPHGAGPEKMLSHAEERGLMHAYHKLIDRKERL